LTIGPVPAENKGEDFRSQLTMVAACHGGIGRLLKEFGGFALRRHGHQPTKCRGGDREAGFVQPPLNKSNHLNDTLPAPTEGRASAIPGRPIGVSRTCLAGQ